MCRHQPMCVLFGWRFRGPSQPRLKQDSGVILNGHSRSETHYGIINDYCDFIVVMACGKCDYYGESVSHNTCKLIGTTWLVFGQRIHPFGAFHDVIQFHDVSWLRCVCLKVSSSTMFHLHCKASPDPPANRSIYPCCGSPTLVRVFVPT